MKKIAIQGFRGCFHEQAARQFYAALEKDVPQTVECETFEGVYEAVLDGMDACTKRAEELGK